MKNFSRKYGQRIRIGLMIALLPVLLVGTAVGLWLNSLPLFQDVTMELGDSLPPIEAFLTEHADPQKAGFAAEKGVDVSQVGTQTLLLRHGDSTQAVKLTVQDTTAPTLKLQDLVRPAGYVPVPEDFVAESFDLSQTTVSFAQEIPAPEHYNDVTVEVVITDTYGNSTREQATLSYVWLPETYALELGDTLEKADLLANPEKDGNLLDQAQLDVVNQGGVGEYTLTSTDGDRTCTCTVTVADTTGPVLVVKDLQKALGERKPKVEDFVKEASDLSGEVTLTLLDEPDTGKVSNQVIRVEARDIYGNTTVMEAKLHILEDTSVPNFSGLGTLTVEKHSTPNYRKGVSAYDKKDGDVEFTYDASKVNTSKAGTYYVTYTASDKSGNVKTQRRKVVVKPDAEDTKALVIEAASKCGTGVEEMRDYVRQKIAYNTNWGGDDPVYYGFTNRKGNCYVHAMCLKALLDYRGYTSKLIWVTNKSHYWLLVDMGGYWRHVDPTPGSRHSEYSLMTDEQRYKTLQNDYPEGRDWDRSQWPAAE